MKRVIKHGWRLGALVVVALLLFVWLIKAPIMSHYLSAKLGIPVTVRTISMWPTKTRMRHFRIENPRMFKERTALEVKKTTINYTWGDLHGTPHEIDLILLEDVFLNIDIRSLANSENNWAYIGAQIPKNRHSREVIVHKLILKNMTVKTKGAGAVALGVSGTKHFDYLEFNEINSKEGFPTKELIGQIFGKVGLHRILRDFLNPSGRVRNALNPFTIFGQKKALNQIEGLLSEFRGSLSNPFLDERPQESSPSLRL